MALINCPECGKEISDLAKYCPNCGFQIKREEKDFRKKLVLMLGLAFIIVFGVILFIVVGNLPYNAQNAEEKRRDKYLEEIDTVSETFPDTGITFYDIRLALLQGQEDIKAMTKYAEDITTRTNDLVVEFQNAMIDEDINIPVLENKVIDLLMDMEKYEQANSLFIKRQIQTDTWVIKLGLRYCKQYKLAQEEKNDVEIVVIMLKFLDVTDKRLSDSEEMRKAFEDIEDYIDNRS